jgi:hypothetical protein
MGFAFLLTDSLLILSGKQDNTESGAKSVDGETQSTFGTDTYILEVLRLLIKRVRGRNMSL